MKTNTNKNTTAMPESPSFGRGWGGPTTAMPASPLYGRGLGEAPFEIRPYNFGELAQMYYPDHPYDSALRLFREEMHQTRGLWDAMVAQGNKEKKKVLTRAQVKVIVKFLDPPI